MTVILTGTICDNTCLGYSPGDDTPDYFGLFGPVFGDLMGAPFTLVENGTNFSLTINNHTVSFGAGDPHFAIGFTDPLLASFSPGAFMFTATGQNQFGFAVAETEFGCPVPGVPEPTTWALMLLGFGLLAGITKLKRMRTCGRQLRFS